MKAIWINAKNKCVSAVEVFGLSDMQERVGGWIQAAHSFLDDSGVETDTLYVDEEGLLKEPQHFFYLEGAHHPFGSNGLIVGFEGATGKSLATTKDPLEIQKKVRFLTPFEALILPALPVLNRNPIMPMTNTGKRGKVLWKVP